MDRHALLLLNVRNRHWLTNDKSPKHSLLSHLLETHVSAIKRLMTNKKISSFIWLPRINQAINVNCLKNKNSETMKFHNIVLIILLIISTSSLNAQLRVIDNGYVGIGDNQITPGSLLELTDNGWLRFNAPSGTSGILFYRSGTSTPTDVQNGGKIYFDGNNNRLRIGTMNNNSFRQGITIDGPNGNVGIGTNPSSTYKLRIQGNSLLNGNLRLENTAYPGQRFHLDISGLNFMSSLIELPGIPAGQIGSSSQQ